LFPAETALFLASLDLNWARARLFPRIAGPLRQETGLFLAKCALFLPETSQLEANYGLKSALTGLFSPKTGLFSR